MSGQLSPHRTLKRGSRLDAIVVLELLRSDDFSNTYRARDGRRAETVIIQEYFPVLRAERAKDNVTVVAAGDMTGDSFETGLAGFLHQAQSLSALRDPHIRRVSHYAEANGTAYLLMPDEPGQMLEVLIERDDPAVLSEKGLRELGRSMLSALRTLDSVGMVHGDISPETIYVRREGDAMLTDFGMARHDFFESCDMAGKSLRDGYAPLELYGARHDQGVWTDIYSLGATLYRCVARQDPPSSVARAQAVNEGKRDPMQPASEIAEGRFSRGFLGEIDDMLMLNPEQRPRDPSVLLGLDARTAPVRFQSVESEPAPVAAATPEPRSGQMRWGMLAGASAALAVTLVAGFWLKDRNDNEARPEVALKAPTSVVTPVAESAPAPEADAAVGEEKPTLSKTSDEPRMDEYRRIRQAEDESALAREIERRVGVRLEEERVAREQEVAAAANAKVQRDQEQLKSLLADGKRAFDEGRVATPPGNSAIYFYQEALYIERDNAEARAGLDRVFDDVKLRADAALASGDVYTGRGLIEVLRLNRPDDGDIDTLLSRANSSQAERDDMIRSELDESIRLQLNEQAEKTESSKRTEKASSVSRLVERGFSALKRAQFTNPRADSAVSNFREALVLDPGNADALEGINAVYQTLATAAMEALAQSRIETAQKHLAEIESVDKNHPVAVVLRRAMQGAKAVAEDNRDAVIAELSSRAEVAELRLAELEKSRRAETDELKQRVQASASTAEQNQGLQDRVTQQAELITGLNRQLEQATANERALSEQLATARSSAPAPAPAQTGAVSSPASADTVPPINEQLIAGVQAYYSGNYADAFNTLRPIAGLGDSRAQFRVGVMYFHGRGVQPNVAEANRWFGIAVNDIRTRAQQGESWAQADLGTMYERGWGVNQNYEIAASWYAQAVGQNYAPAQNNLGVLLEQGLGVTRNRNEAIKLLRLAASQGDAIARENLTILGGN